MSEEKKANGLWLKKDKNGNDYLSGSLDESNWINIYKNTYKVSGSKQPDYRFVITPKKNAQDDSARGDAAEDFI